MKTKSTRPMRVLLAGLGVMGNHWLRIIAASNEVELVAAVEVNPALAQDRFERYGLDPKLHFTSFDDALARSRPDGVLIVTPPAAHREMSIAALEAGVPVLSEKPLADSLAAGEAILAAAQRTGVLHLVCQDYRYSRQAQTVKQVLAAGELGQVGAVKVDFYKSLVRSGFHDTLRYPLTIDMSIHHFDMMRFFMDSNPKSIYGRAWRTPWDWWKGDSSASVFLQFANGAEITYTGSWCATGQETSWNGDWRFECERGVLLLRDDRVIVQRRLDKIDDIKGYPQYLNADPEHVRLVPMKRQRQAFLLHEFYRAVMLHEGQPGTVVQDNINSFRMVWDTIRSFETGETVNIGESS